MNMYRFTKNIEKRFSKILGSFFGIGFMPFAPGTMGSIAIFPILFFINFNLSFFLFILISLIGIIAGNIISKEEKDPSYFVLDEVSGVWVAFLILFNSSFYWKLASLILFRVFDIYKPFGIRKAENLKGGIGIMADDILSGILSGVFLFIIKVVWRTLL